MSAEKTENLEPQDDQVYEGADGEEEEKPDLKGLSKVVVRNEFYRDGYRTLLKIALVQGFVILGLIGSLYVVVQTNKPQNRFFCNNRRWPPCSYGSA